MTAEQTPAPAVTPASFRAALGSFPTGVTVMTAVVDGVPHGMTANAVSSVSLEPPMVLVCVDRTAHMASVVEHAGRFALSILAADQAALSTHFADPARGLGPHEFDGVEVVTGRLGVPLVAGAVAHLECDVDRVVPAGDHLVVLGAVQALDTSTRAPLAYLRGRYGTVEQAPTFG
ncbi:MAG: flavin reductase family protein [Nitriliruptoraceae bacterium]